MRHAMALGLTLLLPLGLARGQAMSLGPGDTARVQIAMVVRAFERDLGRKDWNAVLGHFWPAKVTARWEPPTQSSEWLATSPPQERGVGSGAGSAVEPCGERGYTINVVGRWARVLLPSCAAQPGELWLLEVGGRWRIVRLTFDTPQLTRPEGSSRH